MNRSRLDELRPKPNIELLMRRPALSTPHSTKRTLPATKRSLVDNPASSSPNVKPKANRNKEEENRGKQISLDDMMYAKLEVPNN